MCGQFRLRLISIAFGLLLAVTAQAQSFVLYAVDGSGGNASSLIILDPNTGATMGIVGPTGYSHVTGLAIHPLTGVMYANANSPGTLLTINMSTGAATAIGSTGVKISDLAFSAAGQLYGWSESTDDAVSVNLTTGLATVLGPSGIGTGSSAVEFTAGGMLLVKDHHHNLWEVNTGDGSTSSWRTLENPPSGSGRYRNVAARHPGNGNFYFADRGASDGSNTPPIIYSANVGDATPIQVTQIGTGPSNLSALVFGALPDTTPVPTSSTSGLLLLVLLFLVTVLYLNRKQILSKP